MPSVSICVVLLLSASLLGCVCGKTATSTDPVAGNLINTNTEKPKIFSKPMKEAVTGVFDDIKSWYSNSGDILVNNYSSSTVYDVSYKNIFILVALKLLLVLFLSGGAASLTGRSIEGASSRLDSTLSGFDEKEALFALAFLNGDEDSGYGCLQRLACLEPERATKFLTAAQVLDLLVTAVNRMTGRVEEEQHAALQTMAESVLQGPGTGKCRQRYACPAMPSL